MKRLLYLLLLTFTFFITTELLFIGIVLSFGLQNLNSFYLQLIEFTPYLIVFILIFFLKPLLLRNLFIDAKFSFIPILVGIFLSISSIEIINAPYMVRPNHNFLLLNLIYLTIVVPFTEEFFFRGIILKYFLEKHKALYSILFSSILFSLVHINFIEVNYIVLLKAFIFSVFISFVYLNYGLINSILTHSVINFIIFIKNYHFLNYFDNMEGSNIIKLFILLSSVLFLVYYIYIAVKKIKKNPLL